MSPASMAQLTEHHTLTQLTEHHTLHQKFDAQLKVQFLVRAHTWVASLIPGHGALGRQPNLSRIDVWYLHTHPPHPFLSKHALG